jgi:hypothetical protein
VTTNSIVTESTYRGRYGCHRTMHEPATPRPIIRDPRTFYVVETTDTYISKATYLIVKISTRTSCFVDATNVYISLQRLIQL